MNVTPVAGSIFGSLSQSYPPLEQVHSARSSCTADARPLTGLEKGPNLAENSYSTFCRQPQMEIPSFSQRTGSAQFAKVTVEWVYGMEFP